MEELEHPKKENMKEESKKREIKKRKLADISDLELGLHVMFARKVLRLKQYEFSEILNIRQQTLCKIEKGSIAPSKDFCAKIYFILKEIAQNDEYALDEDQRMILNRIIPVIQTSVQDCLDNMDKLKKVPIKDEYGTSFEQPQYIKNKLKIGDDNYVSKCKH